MPQLLARLPEISRTDVLDIILVAALIYQFMVLIRGTRAMPVLVGVASITIAVYVAHEAELRTINWLVGTMLPYGIFALIVVFQNEIRRALARIGRQLSFSRTVQGMQEAYDDI